LEEVSSTTLVSTICSSLLMGVMSMLFDMMLRPGRA
jgi:hypothetical protein